MRFKCGLNAIKVLQLATRINKNHQQSNEKRLSKKMAVNIEFGNINPFDYKGSPTDTTDRYDSYKKTKLIRCLIIDDLFSIV